MMPPFDAGEAFLKFIGAMSVVTGAMAWWRKDTPEDDAIVADSCDVLINGISDADSTAKIELANGRNIRDQISIEQAIELDRERELRRFPNRN